MESAVAVYTRLMGAPLKHLVEERATATDKILYTAKLVLLAAVALSSAAVVEFLLDSYLRVLVIAWIGAVFFFLAIVDQRARKSLSK